MQWVALMTLADGTLVESSLPSVDETAANLAGRTYRVVHPDGSATVFERLGHVLAHLRDHHGAGDAGAAADRPTHATRTGRS